MPETADQLKIAIIITSIIVSLLIAFILFLFLVFQLRKKKARILLEKEIMRAQIEMQEQTLKTVSQEIHDNIGQILSLAKLNLNVFPSSSIDNDARMKVENTKALLTKAIGDLRDLSRSMHGDKIAELGLHDAIESELRVLQNTGQYVTDLNVVGEPVKLETKKAMVLFRMVQESITNCIKHAKATRVNIKLENQKDKYIVTVSDDGIGFDKARLQSAETGIGLKSMQNRAAMINGAFAVNSAPGEGTTIEITLTK